jgi:NAD(P)H-dependent flavin oxidoreductase YrpB (nitropropane dioxygenase family)
MDTAFTRLVGCRTPIQQAGMGAISWVELAAAVADAGALGMLGTAGLPEGLVLAALDALATRTAGVFGVNFVVGFMDREVVAQAASRAKVVEFFYGDPDTSLVEMVHNNGALVSWQVGSVAEARAATDCGCDLVVVQGIEAGGHIRGQMALLPLLDSVLEVVTVPVLAAGGIATGRSVAAVLAAGAAGARVGTRFLGAQEADVHPVYRQALIAAGPEDTELTSAFSTWWDAPHRVLRGCIAEAMANHDELVGETAWGDGSSIPIPRLCALYPVGATTGRVQAMAHYAGQSVGHVRRVQPAAQIVAELTDGARELLRHAAGPG